MVPFKLERRIGTTWTTPAFKYAHDHRVPRPGDMLWVQFAAQGEFLQIQASNIMHCMHDGRGNGYG